MQDALDIVGFFPNIHPTASVLSAAVGLVWMDPHPTPQKWDLTGLSQSV